MAHTHTHSHHPHQKFTIEFAVSILLNLFFTFAEFIYAFMANSASLLADAGHNLGDVIGLGMAWFAHWLLSYRPTERFSYGFRRTSILAALGNAFLLVLASLFIIYESINKLIHPHPVNENIIIVVAFIGIMINGGAALLFRKENRHDLNLKSIYLHLAYDALISFGVVLTGTLILFTHWYWLDPIVGLLIVVIIMRGTWEVLKDSAHLIMDAVPRDIDLPEVKNYLSQLPGVKEIHDLHIWGLSTREIALTAHLVMPDKTLSDAEYREINDYLHHHFTIHHITLQVEKGDEAHICDQMPYC